jgi:gas vesicle protein
MTVEQFLIFIAGLIVGAIIGGVATFFIIQNNQKQAAALAAKLKAEAAAADAALTVKVNAVIAAVKAGEADVEKIKAML